MHDALLSWLKAQTWPDVRPAEEHVGPASFWHPYGFAAIRLADVGFPGWSARVHLWPAGPATLPELAIHRHGWGLASRTIVGSVVHKLYDVYQPAARRSQGTLCAYRVESDVGVGRSVLERTDCGYAAIVSRVVVAPAGADVMWIPASNFHSTGAAQGNRSWSVTLILAEDDGSMPSRVLAPAHFPSLIVNRRTPIEGLGPVLEEVDVCYRDEVGTADRWVASVFVENRGAILMVRTYRFPNYWQPVGGQATPEDRSPMQTALREVAEETGFGLAPSDLTPLGSLPRDRGRGDIHAWVARVADRDELRVPPEEILDHAWVPIRQLGELDGFAASKEFSSRVAALSLS